MNTKHIFRLFFFLFVAALIFSFLSSRQIENFTNDIFKIQDIDLGEETEGTNLFSINVINCTNTKKNLVIDLRTECICLGMANWQRQFYFCLEPHENRNIELEYEIFSPILKRIILRFGESERFFDREKWVELPSEQQAKISPPKINYFWKKIFLQKQNREIEKVLYDRISLHNVFLDKISEEKLFQIKTELPTLIRQSRREGNLLRKKLYKLFQIDRRYPTDFDFQLETWREESQYYDSLFENSQVIYEVFSISSESSNRITSFFATKKENFNKKKPLILLLSGNPPGTKESLIESSIYFSKIGYHTVGIDRRQTSRILDKKEKFLTNYSDPVCDILRMIDFLSNQSKFKISNIGIYGFSAGAAEGKFVAAMDDRINAAVLACGITSHNWMFRDKAWFPTYSGMIIFPELGLGKPDIGNLTSEEFWENYNKLNPQHNARARETFNKEFPFFEDMDPLKVTPLIAPIPILIVSGAQDDQFITTGVVEVDRAVQKAYKKYGLQYCSEIYIQPRIGHTVDTKGSYVIAAFFERWLK